MKTLLKLSKILAPLFPIMLCAVILGSLGHFCAIGIPVFGALAIYEKFPVRFLVLVGLMRGIFHYGEQYCNHFIAFTVLARIRDKVFGKLRELGPAKIETKEKGNLVALITSDIELLEVFYAHTISPFFIAITVCLGICIFLGHINIRLCLVALGFYLTVGVITPAIVNKKAVKQGELYRNQFADLNSFLLDSLRGILQSILYGLGLKKLSEIEAKSKELWKTQKKMSQIEGFTGAVTGLWVSLGGISMLFTAIYLCSNKTITFQDAVISVITMFSSFGPVIALANLGSGLSSTIASGKRILDLLEEKPVIEPVRFGKEVEFCGAKVENVSFSYSDEEILSAISLNFSQNKTIGIKGKSGSGKSTLLKLFMHFWEADSGTVEISSTDVKNINSDCLKSIESYVTQETILFHDSIENNVKIAKLDSTKEEIIEACKKAQIHQLIESLPDGYETKISELGENFSGGERQRLGLARAFLHKGEFLLLDEPTSNIDSYNEEQIIKTINQESADKTVVIISHRDSTFKYADVIYKLESDRKS